MDSQLKTINPETVREISAEMRRRKKSLGNVRVQRGLKLWECNETTGEITPAPMQVSDTVNIDGQAQRSRLEIKKGCRYVLALNLENARRKFEDLQKQIKNGKDQ